MQFCISSPPHLLPHGWKLPLLLLPVSGSYPGSAAYEAGYINAAAFMVGHHLGKPLVHFFIDYPKTAAIFKAFKKKNNLSEILLKGFSDCMNIPIICVKDETKYNVPMELTMKEDVYDWDDYWN